MIINKVAAFRVIDTKTGKVWLVKKLVNASTLNTEKETKKLSKAFGQAGFLGLFDEAATVFDSAIVSRL